MENEQKFYVYVDYREDDGRPFYVGKGNEGRVQDLKRNRLHTNIRKKHGVVRKVVFESFVEQECFDKEVELIQELGTHVDHGRGGSNLTLGGDGISGYRYTEEQREKKSESNKKRWEDPEYREKISGVFSDPEYKKKLSELNKERFSDPEQKKKMSEKLREVYSDPELREKMGRIIKEKLSDPDVRKKMSESIKEVWKDPEFIEKRSKKFSEPEFKKKTSESIKKGLSKRTPEQKSEQYRKSLETKRLKDYHHNPEVKKKMSESRKSYLSKLTPEQKSERIRKYQETCRLRKLQQEVDRVSDPDNL